MKQKGYKILLTLWHNMVDSFKTIDPNDQHNPDNYPDDTLFPITIAIKDHLQTLHPTFTYTIKKLLAQGWSIEAYHPLGNEKRADYPHYHLKITAKALILQINNLPYRYHYNPHCQTGMILELHRLPYEDPNTIPTILNTINKIINHKEKWTP